MKASLISLASILLGTGIFFLKDRFYPQRSQTSLDTLNALHVQLANRKLIAFKGGEIPFFKKTAANEEVPSDTIPFPDIVTDFDTLTNEKLLQKFDDELFAMYGLDNREDISCRNITTRESFNTSHDALIASARKVCALIPKNLMVKLPDGRYKITSKTLLETKFKNVKPCSVSSDVCFNNTVYNENIRYSDQKVGACCTGFGYKSNQIVTANHCFKNKTLSEYFFVFGYGYFPQGNSYDVIPAEDVFEGISVVRRSASLDFAIIQLNRPLRPGQVAAVDLSPVNPNQPIYMAGHPDGLPLKLTLDATANFSDPAAAEFATNLDAFHGNSGSPVFNSSGKLIGVLLKGDKDYESVTSGCARYYKSTTSYNEQVLKASRIR